VVGSDPWLDVAWKVYAVQGVDGQYLKPGGKEGSFTLQAVPAVGPAVYYTPDFISGEMPACWGSLRLFPRGSVPFLPPSPLLLPWTQQGNAPWLAAADEVRNGLNVSMTRLEGDLCPDGNIKALTMVCVPKATTSGTPLLVLKVVSQTAGGQVLPQDTPTGGGHGDN
jgi:hypothetical protein